MYANFQIIEQKNWMRFAEIATGIMVVFAAAFQLSLFFLSDIQIFASGYEFISYRIGDAVSMMFGEERNVHPVQGLPSALVSKILTKLLYLIYGVDIVTAPILQLYSALFFLVGFAFLATVLVATWKHLTWVERGGAALMTFAPWYIIFPGFHYLFAPEYWFAEYIFLASTSLILPIISRAESRFMPVLIGVWIGIGVSTKITLVGIAPIIFFTMTRHSWRDAFLGFAASVATYLLIIWAYAGFRFGIATQIIVFQINFFLDPNLSATYPDIGKALTSNLIVTAFLGMTITATLLGFRRRSVEALFSLLWIALFVYMLWKRPHDSTLASAGLALIFICSRFLPLYRSLIVTAVAVAVILVPLNYDWLLASQKVQRAFHPSNVPEWFKPTGLLFIVNNYWNATVPLHTFGYNGMLGLHPITDDGKSLRYQSGHGVAFQALFGDIVISDQLGYVVSALKKGKPVFWTRPADNALPEYIAATREDYSALRKRFADIRADVVEQCGPHSGMNWCFGVARPSAPQADDRDLRTPVAAPK